MITDEKLNVLSKEQAEMVKRVSNNNGDEIAKNRLIELHKLMRSRREELLADYKDKTKEVINQTNDILNSKVVDKKRIIRKQYNEMIFLYRQFNSMALMLSEEKKRIRELIQSL